MGDTGVETRPVASLPIHALTVPEVLAQLATTPAGLTEAEARVRLARFGPNRVTAPPLRAWLFAPAWVRLAALAAVQLVAVLLALAAGEAGITVALALFGAGVVAAGAAVAARRPLSVLRLAVPAAARARVLRRPQASPLPPAAPAEGRAATGAWGVISATGLVPGDVILLGEGDRVPADARLIRALDLVVSRAELTGDAGPLVRTAEAVPEPDLAAAAAPNVVLAGMRVLAGSGRAVVLATGDASYLGNLTRTTEAVGRRPNPLWDELCQLSLLGAAITGLLALIAGFAGLMTFDASRAALFAVSVLAAASALTLVPVAAIALAIVTAQLRRRGVHARGLAAVDTLGAATMIVSEVIPGLGAADPASRGTASPERTILTSEPRLVALGDMARFRLRMPGEVEAEALIAGASSAGKLQSVAASQAAGHVVAMAGDLLGDVPALRQADVALVLGGERSSVVRDAGDVRATASGAVAAAIDAGRRIYAGLGRAGVLILAGIIPALIAALLAVFGIPPALGVAQVLVMRLLAELPLALGLALIPAGSSEPPRGRRQLLARRDTLTGGLALGALEAVVVMYVFLAGLSAMGWPPGKLEALGGALAIPATATAGPGTPETPAATEGPRPTATPVPTATPEAPVLEGGLPPGQEAAAAAAEARLAVGRAQAGALAAWVLTMMGAALAVALWWAPRDLGRLGAHLFPMWPAIGVSLIGLAAVLGIEPVRAELGLGPSEVGPWLIGMAAALAAVLGAAAWRLLRGA